MRRKNYHSSDKCKVRDGFYTYAIYTNKVILNSQSRKYLNLENELVTQFS